jgi:hypothetical protein
MTPPAFVAAMSFWSIVISAVYPVIGWMLVRRDGFRA